MYVVQFYWRKTQWFDEQEFNSFFQAVVYLIQCKLEDQQHSFRIVKRG